MFVFLCCMGAASSASYGFTITSWRLASGVFDFSIPQGDSNFNEVPHPSFNQSLDSAYANSLAQAAYQYNYDNATGQFDTNVHLESQGGSHFGSTVNSLVRFTTSTDVLLHAEGEWTYALPGGFRTSEFNIRVGKIPHDNSFFFIDGGFASPGLGDPPSGTHDAELNVLLPAGGTYFFRSIFSFDASSGSPTALSIGSGFANVTLTSVPSPATLGPLAVATLLIRRPVRRR